MANDADSKVLSLSNIKILKDYISKSIEEASMILTEEYNNQYDELQNKIDTINNGNIEGLEELRLELDALNANFEDKKMALESLSNDFNNLSNGIKDGSVFSDGQLYEIIKTAMIEETVITPDMVSTPNVFTQQIVALIGNFGSVKASNLTAGTIKGSSIESTKTISSSNDPVWRINNNGDGYLASKNISWDKAGNVTFGDNVKFSWNNISNKPADLGGSSGNGLSEEDVNNMIATEISKYEVTAENIKGTTLSGKTIKADNDSWKLDNTGAGYLANENIKWDTSGNVTFGSNVNISWSNVDHSEIDTTIGQLSAGISLANTTANTANAAANDAKVAASNANTVATEAKTTAELASTNATSVSLSIEGIKDKVDSINNFTKEQIEEYATNITESTVTTDFVNALNVRAATIKAEGLAVHAGYIGELAADNIVVKQLNTDPDSSKDRIEISENHVYCIDNSSSNKTLIISSNNIDTNVINKLSTDQIGTDIDVNTLTRLKDIILNNPSNINSSLTGINVVNKNSIYTNNNVSFTNLIANNAGTWELYNSDSVDELGYLFKNATLKLKPWIRAYKKVGSSVSNVHALSWDCFAKLVLIAYKKNESGEWVEYSKTEYNPYYGSANALTYTVDLSTGFLNIDINNSVWRSACCQSAGSGTFKIINSNQTGTSYRPYYKVFNNTGTGLNATAPWPIILNITENGSYGIRLKLEQVKTSSGTSIGIAPIVASSSYTMINSNGSLSATQDNLLNSLLFSYDIDVTGNSPASYTEIGKNGIIACNGQHILTCNPSGTEMRSIIKEGSKNTQNFYGFKVTNNGLYCCNGSNNYILLDDYIKSVITSTISE